MKINLFRPAGIAVVAIMSAGLLVLGATAAGAAPAPGTLGTLTNSPATGTDVTAPKVHTSAGCPTTADAYNAVLTGPGAFAPGFLITPTQSPGFSTTTGFDVQFGLSFKDAATDLATTIVAGEYDATVNCVDSFSGNVMGTFTGAFYFTTPTAYQSTDPNAPVPTTTALAVAPPSPVVQGTSVTLTATVSPATATGTVQFKDGANNLGGVVTVSAGVATLATSALTAGTHSLTAVFTGSAPNIQGSTSPAVSYVVTTPVATPTTTALAVSPSGSVVQFTPVTLSATVSPSAAAGSAQFTDGGANLGNPVPVSGGAASLTVATLTVGSHSFTARFVPANPAAFTASESPAVPLTITAFTGVSTSEDITTTVQAGALTISVANSHVTLPSPTLTTDGTKLTTAGSLNPVTVTDTRAGNLGWNVSGQASDFSDGLSHSINAGNLGWTPKVVDQAATQTVTAGPAVPPANAIAPGVVPPPGLGLASSRVLATAAAGAGIGTAHVSADVALNVPTSTVAGTYTSTLTLTAI
jgi:hypothetical protein